MSKLDCYMIQRAGASYHEYGPNMLVEVREIFSMRDVATHLYYYQVEKIHKLQVYYSV
jgi:hypothetical protein